MTTPRLAKRVLLVGWDAADWQVMSPLLDAGKMPALNGLVERGVMGNIATLQPCLSPILWTSIATGKQADKHGVLGFVEPDGAGGVRHASSTTRETKAIWNILSQSGLRAHVVGWYASHPAEPINGVCVSNVFDENAPAPGQPWPLPADSVHPARWREPVAAFRLHPGELTVADLRSFIPDIDSIDLNTDRRPFELAMSLAHCVSVHSAATAIMENEPWDFMAVYYDMIDTAGHVFMPYHPPRMEHVPERDYDLYRGVMERVYLFHDEMLARLLQLAGDDTTVILLSDHGFYSDHRRPRTLAVGDSPEALAAHWHRPLGALCIAGDGIKRDERIYGASLLDIAPTVLTLFGLPSGRDMDGRPLVEALETPLTVETIESWDEAPGAAGMHPPELRVDPVSAQATIDRLVALGYMDSKAADPQAAARVAIDEADFNLAVVYMNSSRPGRAIPLLEKLFAAHPENFRYGMSLAQALAAHRRPADSRVVLETIESNGGRTVDLDVAMAGVLLDLGEEAAALDRIMEADRAAPGSLAIQCALGRVHMARREWEAAEADYRRALAIDGDSLHARHVLTQALLEQRKYEEAASLALEMLDVVHFFPKAHYQLGIALEGLGMEDRALEAFGAAVRMAPHFSEAHRRLAAIYRRRGSDVEALRHESAANGMPWESDSSDIGAGLDIFDAVS
ncbi:MAG: alkaline phosphatase family protein [Phycisphaerales bacterium]|nr:alkaline phosphatase family protein [Phycisphaerales bacterium]